MQWNYYQSVKTTIHIVYVCVHLTLSENFPPYNKQYYYCSSLHALTNILSAMKIHTHSHTHTRTHAHDTHFFSFLAFWHFGIRMTKFVKKK